MNDLLLASLRAERMDEHQLAIELRRIAHKRMSASPRQEQRLRRRAGVFLEAWEQLQGGPAHQCPRCGVPCRGAELTICDRCAVATCGGTRGT